MLNRIYQYTQARKSGDLDFCFLVFLILTALLKGINLSKELIGNLTISMLTLDERTFSTIQ